LFPHLSVIRSAVGALRWVALSGDPADIAKTDQAMLKLFPEDKR
jgi:urocanate hydratase